MAEELVSLHLTQTSNFVSLIIGKGAFGSLWVKNVKTKSCRSIERHKALLVAKGCV